MISVASEGTASTQAPWANHAFGDKPHVTLEALQAGLTVGLIATARSDLVTCAKEETLAQVVERHRHDQFDFLPVTDEATKGGAGTSNIVGLLEIAKHRHGATVDGSVGMSSAPLSENNLIGADASILAFIRDAHIHKCRLVVSGSQISGLVTLSDLQQLPVRAALFGLVTHLEILMGEVIRREFKGTTGWLDRLSEDRQVKLRDELGNAQHQDDMVDPLLFTQFADKKKILAKSDHLKTSRTAFNNDLEQIQTLRDHLAHANDYAASSEAAIETCKTVHLIDSWREKFSRWFETN